MAFGQHPANLQELRGVYITLKRNGKVLCRPWVDRSIIQKRAQSNQSGPVWNSQWGVEMAQKTAIKYCVARGTLVIDSNALDAGLSAGQVIDQELEPATVSQALGQDGERPQIDPPSPLDDLPIASTGDEGKGEPVVIDNPPQTSQEEPDGAPM